MATATVHTSAGVRDMTAIATRIIQEDPLFASWRTDALGELVEHGPFLQALGRAIAGRIDWNHVAWKRGQRKPKR